MVSTQKLFFWRKYTGMGVHSHHKQVYCAKEKYGGLYRLLRRKTELGVAKKHPPISSLYLKNRIFSLLNIENILNYKDYFIRKE